MKIEEFLMYRHQANNHQSHAPAQQGQYNHNGPQHIQQPLQPRGNDAFEETELARHFQLKVFGKKHALCVVPTFTKRGWHTLTIEAASKPEGSAGMAYDWANKKNVQLTMQELPVVVAMLHSLLPSVEYKNHGVNNDKGFSIEKQDRGFFFRVFAANQGVNAIPVSFPEVALIANLALEQYTKNFKHISSDVIFSNLKTMARDMYKSKTAPLVSNGFKG